MAPATKSSPNTSPHWRIGLSEVTIRWARSRRKRDVAPFVDGQQSVAETGGQVAKRELDGYTEASIQDTPRTCQCR
jgi:hypothetical protein